MRQNSSEHKYVAKFLEQTKKNFVVKTVILVAFALNLKQNTNTYRSSES